MSYRTTLADAQNPLISGIGKRMGLCPTDPRVTLAINQGTQLLLTKGKWWGTICKFTMCISTGCVTLPPQIATIEAVKRCNRSLTVRDIFFPFLANRTDWDWESSCWPDCVSQGCFPTFADIQGVNSKLLFLCDVAADVGAKVLCLGYDQNGNWIRTMQGGVWADGEVISLAQSPGTSSTNFFTRLTDLQIPSGMHGQSWLYAYDTVLNQQIMLGHYQAFETRPSYQRYRVPFLNQLCNGTPVQVPIEAIGKLDFVPVVNPTDYLIVPNLRAMEEICAAINKSGQEPEGIKSNQILQSGIATACKILDDELAHYRGDGVMVGVNIQGSGMPDASPLPVMI